LLELNAKTVTCASVCAPGAVLGCKVCNALGTGWFDDNSKCAANQTCQNGQCVSGSTYWNTDLVGWWKFDDGSGESPLLFKDWSGSWNQAICNLANPCPMFVTGKFGKALNFTGNNYLEAVVSPTLKKYY